jgi:hypothetical protein
VPSATWSPPRATGPGVFPTRALNSKPTEPPPLAEHLKPNSARAPAPVAQCAHQAAACHRHRHRHRVTASQYPQLARPGDSEIGARHGFTGGHSNRRADLRLGTFWKLNRGHGPPNRGHGPDSAGRGFPGLTLAPGRDRPGPLPAFSSESGTSVGLSPRLRLGVHDALFNMAASATRRGGRRGPDRRGPCRANRKKAPLWCIGLLSADGAHATVTSHSSCAQGANALRPFPGAVRF